MDAWNVALPHARVRRKRLPSQSYLTLLKQFAFEFTRKMRSTKPFQVPFPRLGVFWAFTSSAFRVLVSVQTAL